MSVAVTDTLIVMPADTSYLGNPKSCIGIRVKSDKMNSKLRIKVAESPFFSESISEFILPKARTEYLVYPDIVWKYDALKENIQPTPVSVAVQVEMNRDNLGQKVRTFSMRSINECLLGYNDINQEIS